MVSHTRAIELVTKLARTKKYPTTDDGVADLARGLQHASEAAKIGAGRIIDRCASISEWCPSDAELLLVAQDLAREDAVADGTYDSMASAANCAPKLSKADLEREYGPPQPIVVTAAVKTRGKVAQDRHKRMWQEIRDKLHLRPNEDYPSWQKCAAAARELGYMDYADGWERLVK